jgi:DNA-directed RNA polymerase subunit M/transcription elongation factor TFIIS
MNDKIKTDKRECPKCGSTKHQEILRVQTEAGDETATFKCNACGHHEMLFEHDAKKEQEAIEHMGDAFREFLAKKEKKKQ